MRLAHVLAVLAAASSAVPASAQSLPSLADLAAKEAARRAAIKEPARVITDKDLPASTAAPRAAPPAMPDKGAGGARALEQAATAKQKAAAETDDNGHDERWWAARVAPLVQRLHAATRKLQTAKARVEQVSLAMNRAGGRARAALAQKLQNATVEAERLSAEVLEARRAFEDLEDEARRAGALPGWLRK